MISKTLRNCVDGHRALQLRTLPCNHDINHHNGICKIANLQRHAFSMIKMCSKPNKKPSHMFTGHCSHKERFGSHQLAPRSRRVPQGKRPGKEEICENEIKRIYYNFRRAAVALEKFMWPVILIVEKSFVIFPSFPLLLFALRGSSHNTPPAISHFMSV